jgi:hypothetical protein
VADWDEDSPRLLQNLVGVLREVRDAARRRDVASTSDAKKWQQATMAGLVVPDPKYVGRFRGEVGLRTIAVRVGAREGVAPPK